MRTEAILWLMKSFDWRCFITAYYEGHRAGHNLWPIWEEFSSDPPEGAMLDVYREIDTQIGRLLDALDLKETGFVLFSMHGMTPGFSQDHFLPKLHPAHQRPLSQGARVRSPAAQAEPRLHPAADRSGHGSAPHS